MSMIYYSCYGGVYSSYGRLELKFPFNQLIGRLNKKHGTSFRSAVVVNRDGYITSRRLGAQDSFKRFDNIKEMSNLDSLVEEIIRRKLLLCYRKDDLDRIRQEFPKYDGHEFQELEFPSQTN